MITYLFWFFSTLCLNELASIYATKKAKKNKIFQILPDIIHEHIPKIRSEIPDVLLFFCAAATLWIPLKNIESLLWSLSVRPIFVCATILPTCVQDSNLFYFSQKTNDLLFSGHTCFFMFFGDQYNSVILKLFIKYCLPFTLVIARQHYTVDILVSMFVYNYFTLCVI